MAGFSYANTSVVLTTAEGTTVEIDYQRVRKAMIFIPNGSSITTLTVLAAPVPGGTYEAAQDDSGAIVLTVAEDMSYQLPSELEGAGAIKLVANAAGTIQMSFLQQ